MRHLTVTLAIIGALTFAVGCDKNDEDTQPEIKQSVELAEHPESIPEPIADPEPTPEPVVELDPEPQVDVASRREQLQTSTSRACAHRIECELQGIPEALRNAVDEEALCRTFRNRSNRVDLDEISEACFGKVTTYFDCLGSANCDTLKASGDQACESETSQMVEACDGPLF